MIVTRTLTGWLALCRVQARGRTLTLTTEALTRYGALRALARRVAMVGGP
jgi:hypothetical protein